MAPRRALLDGRADPRAVQAAFRRLLDAPPGRRESLLAELAVAEPLVLAAVERLLRHADPATGFLVPPRRVEWLAPRGEIGRVLGGRWRLTSFLGAGGSGAVFRATDRETGQRAALKLVRGLSAERTRAVRREIAFLRWLRLPGVVRLLDDGIEGDDVFCVMELIRGDPFPGAGNRGAWDAVEGPALRLLATLAGIHAVGVVHRDLKPANVLVAHDGAVTVLDLGVSAEVPRNFDRRESTARGGTPAYAAPEQRRGARPDPRSDLYALGVMLFEALAARRPAEDGRGDCRRLDAPRRVRRAIAALLEPRKSDRPRDAWSAMEALQPPPSSRRRTRTWSEAELRRRFAGPDLLLHLREDGAAELLRRTGGRPLDVEREVRSWVRTGLAREEGKLVVVTRDGLERLQVLGHARGRASRTRSVVPEARLLHALQSGTPRRIARTAEAAASRSLGEGRPQAALAAAFEGAAAARAAGNPRAESRILVLAATASIVLATADALDRALLLLQRAEASGEELHDVEEVVRAAIAFGSGRAGAALASVEGVCRRSRSAAVLRLAWSVRDVVARGAGPREERRAVAGLRRWLPRARVEGWQSILASANGWRCYRESRFDEAVEHHREAARRAPDAHARLRCLLDGAVAAIEGALPGALELAEQARSVAARLRNPIAEGRAVELVRTVHLQRGTATAPDAELVRVCRLLGYPGLTAGVALTEAAIAWRMGRRAESARLARLAAATDGPAPRALLARALAGAASRRISRDEAERCESGLNVLPPAVALQVLALLACTQPARRSHLRELAGRLRLPLRIRRSRHVREVLSVQEAEELLCGTTDEILSPPVRGRRVSP